MKKSNAAAGRRRRPSASMADEDDEIIDVEAIIGQNVPGAKIQQLQDMLGSVSAARYELGHGARRTVYE
jgi:hypothetical protein